MAVGLWACFMDQFSNDSSAVGSELPFSDNLANIPLRCSELNDFFIFTISAFVS